MTAEDKYLNHISRTVGLTITQLDHHAEDYQNRHYRGRTSTGTETFVKVLTDRNRWQQTISAAAVVEPLWPNTPRLLDHGYLDDGSNTPSIFWLIYEWKKLTTFRPTAAALKEVGAMVGKLHTETHSLGLQFARCNLDAEITERIDRLDQLAPDAANRARMLYTRWGPAELPDNETLIHGDLHRRNFNLDINGIPTIVDLENVRVGHPILDFGRLFERHSLPDEAHRIAFFSGYEREATPVWPWHEAMRHVRLWTTAGILAYSLTINVPELTKYSYICLAQLEKESGTTHARLRG